MLRQIICLLCLALPVRACVFRRFFESSEFREEINALQNHIGLVVNDARGVTDLIEKIKSGNEGDNNVLAKFVGYLSKLELDTRPHEEQIANITSIWKVIRDMGEEKLDQFAKEQDLINATVDDFLANHAKYIGKLKEHIGKSARQITVQRDKMMQSVGSFKKNHGAAFKRSRQLDLAMTRINEKMDKISEQQSAEIEQLRGMTKSLLDELSKVVQKIGKRIPDEVLPAARKALDQSSSLRDMLQSSLETIAERLNATIDEQWRLELIIKFGQTVNRIEYLHRWFDEIVKDDEDEKNEEPTAKEELITWLEEIERDKPQMAEELITWANATLYGLPSGQPLEELIVDLVRFIAGGAASPIECDFEIGQSKGTSLLEIYRGNVKEITDETTVIEFADEKQQFIETFSSETPPSSLLAPESEGYLAEAIAHELRRIETAAFDMALKANVILARKRHEEPIARFRREASKPAKKSNKRTNLVQDRVRYHNISNIFVDIGKFYTLQEEAFNEVFGNASQVIRVNVPRIVGSQLMAPTPDTDTEFVIRGPTASAQDCIRQLTIASPAKGDMLMGCRFCSASKCLKNSGNSASIVTQCFFQSVTNPRGYDVFPRNGKEEAKAAFRNQSGHVTSFQTLPFKTYTDVSVVQGINRADDPKTQFVCGVVVKTTVTQQYPKALMSLSIKVCSVKTGELIGTKNAWNLGTKSLEPGLEVVTVPIHVYNAMWVRQGGGLTVGVGFFVSQYPSSTEKVNILNLALEDKFEPN